MNNSLQLSQQDWVGLLGKEYELLKLAIPHYDDFESKITELLACYNSSELKESVRVLDMGCGTGITTMHALNAGSNIMVDAVDNESVMLEQMADMVTATGNTGRVHLINADALSHLQTIPDNYYDAVVTGYVLHNLHFAEREEIVREVYRVLKPGGIFVNADKVAYSDPLLHQKIFNQQIQSYDVYDTIGRSDYKQEWIEHYHKDEHPDLKYTATQMLQVLSDSGFTVNEVVYRLLLECVIFSRK